MSNQARISTGADTLQTLRFAAIAVIANLLLIVSAKVQVPFWPIPMTMQTGAVLAIGMGLGARGAALVIGGYLLEGALGLPVFAGTPQHGLGLAYMVGPTGGYLVGFLVAGVLVGLAAERGWTSSIARALFTLSLAHVFILAIGAVWLSVMMGWQSAWTFGVAPFLVGTVFKAGLGAALCWPLTHLRRGLNPDD